MGDQINCYSCKYFKWYNLITENVECSVHEAVHFEDDQERICDYYCEE